MGNVGKPRFAHLLPPAGLIEFHNQIGLFRIEVCRGVIEREVSVLTDPDKCNVNGRGGQCGTHAVDDFMGVCITVQQVVAVVDLAVFWMSCSSSSLRKLPGCVIGRPMYSSRWKTSTLLQSIPGNMVKASRN